MNDPILGKALEEADRLDPSGERTVPVLALTLLSASMSATHEITESLIEHHKKDAARERSRANAAEDGLFDVAELHKMLATPGYARRLAQLLKQLGPLNYGIDDDDEGEY